LRHCCGEGVPPPRFFVSVDFKRVSFSVSPLESTLMGDFVGVDCKGFRLYSLHKDCATRHCVHSTELMIGDVMALEPIS